MYVLLLQEALRTVTCTLPGVSKDAVVFESTDSPSLGQQLLYGFVEIYDASQVQLKFVYEISQ